MQVGEVTVRKLMANTTPRYSSTLRRYAELYVSCVLI